MGPKARDEAATTSNTTNSSSTPQARGKQPLILPPNTIFGKIVELKKPELSSMSGTEHGLLQIENGPWEKGKAFFNRSGGLTEAPTSTMITLLSLLLPSLFPTSYSLSYLTPRNCLFCWGHNCAKADLMYLIMDGDKFCVEVADGTNNKAVPYKVTRIKKTVVTWSPGHLES